MSLDELYRYAEKCSRHVGIDKTVDALLPGAPVPRIGDFLFFRSGGPVILREGVQPDYLLGDVVAGVPGGFRVVVRGDWDQRLSVWQSIGERRSIDFYRFNHRFDADHDDSVYPPLVETSLIYICVAIVDDRDVPAYDCLLSARKLAELRGDAVLPVFRVPRIPISEAPIITAPGVDAVSLR